jgi:hypothetical protein
MIDQENPSRYEIVAKLRSGERDVVEDADRTEGSLTELRFIHLASNGSIEVQYDYDTGVASTVAGTVVAIDLVNDA